MPRIRYLVRTFPGTGSSDHSTALRSTVSFETSRYSAAFAKLNHTVFATILNYRTSQARLVLAMHPLNRYHGKGGRWEKSNKFAKQNRDYNAV